MKGDRERLHAQLTAFVKMHDGSTLEEMQEARCTLDYNEACAALSALNMLYKKRIKLRTV